MAIYERVSPQGPKYYFGELQRSEYCPGAISIYGPTLSDRMEMTYGEVYLFHPPATESPVKPVVDYEWLQLHLGQQVEIWKEIPDGARPLEAFLFRVKNNHNLTVELAEFPVSPHSSDSC